MCRFNRAGQEQCWASVQELGKSMQVTRLMQAKVNAGGHVKVKHRSTQINAATLVNAINGTEQINARDKSMQGSRSMRIHDAGQVQVQQVQVQVQVVQVQVVQVSVVQVQVQVQVQVVQVLVVQVQVVLVHVQFFLYVVQNLRPGPHPSSSRSSKTSSKSSTTLLKTSSTTMPRTPPSGLRNATDCLH